MSPRLSNKPKLYLLQYYKSNTLFNKVANLEVHKEFINQYKRISHQNNNDTQYQSKSYYSWREVRDFLRAEVFSSDLSEVQGKSLKFYGSDGVCLFKYFVSPDDPQRIFSLSILSLNLICFTMISATYISVIITASGSSGKAAAASSAKDSRSTQLQTKITLMVATNVLSWVPFGVICLLHTLDKIDATRYYKLSSIVLLPINSCVNPIIYSNILIDMLYWIKFKIKGKRKTAIAKIREQFDKSFASSTARDVKKTLRKANYNTGSEFEDSRAAECFSMSENHNNHDVSKLPNICELAAETSDM